MSYEQVLIDAEIIRMIKRVMQGIVVNKDTLALDVIKSVGAGGNYLTQRHTMKYMRAESSIVTLFDRANVKEGEAFISLEQKAKEKTLDIL